MMNTCLNSMPIKIAGFVRESCRHRQSLMQYKGFSLTEVMIALLLVSLSASALISTMVATRIQIASNANFSTAFRLSVELSDWVRQGGLKGLASDAVNPFDLIDQAGSVSACFVEPCHAEAAALFYLYDWRRRLSLRVPNARVVVCQDIALISPASHNWSCDNSDSSVKARVIKIGWPQGSDGRKFPPRFVIALS
jgi:type IV pilus assembly protein PilV